MQAALRRRGGGSCLGCLGLGLDAADHRVDAGDIPAWRRGSLGTPACTAPQHTSHRGTPRPATSAGTSDDSTGSTDLRPQLHPQVCHWQRVACEKSLTCQRQTCACSRRSSCTGSCQTRHARPSPAGSGGARARSEAPAGPGLTQQPCAACAYGSSASAHMRSQAEEVMREAARRTLAAA